MFQLRSGTKLRIAGKWAALVVVVVAPGTEIVVLMDTGGCPDGDVISGVVMGSTNLAEAAVSDIATVAAVLVAPGLKCPADIASVGVTSGPEIGSQSPAEVAVSDIVMVAVAVLGAPGLTCPADIAFVAVAAADVADFAAVAGQIDETDQVECDFLDAVRIAENSARVGGRVVAGYDGRTEICRLKLLGSSVRR